MTSQLGQQTITMQILPNISRSKDNQRIKSGQLWNILTETKAGRLVPDLFLKSNWSAS